MGKGFENYLKKKRNRDEEFILEALVAADQAKGRGDLPVGAVLLLPNNTLSECNTVWSEKDLINHAEINVIRKAAQMGFRRLNNGILYCTVEPCAMCAAAVMEHGIKEIVFGAYDEAHGFYSSKIFNRDNLPFIFRGGVLARECIEILPPHIQKHMHEKLEDESI